MNDKVWLVVKTALITDGVYLALAIVVGPHRLLALSHRYPWLGPGILVLVILIRLRHQRKRKEYR